jgi:hypothetical protein
MSTNWGYRCKSCDEESAYWFNHGQDALNEIVENWSHIVALEKSRWVEVDILRGRTAEIINFLDEHAGHDLILASEYGDTEPLRMKQRELK